ncbi:Uncharacterized protein YxjI [Pseudonocardia ammonioxydans]|uniref:Uncharacterized protein YxjI n=1 Tax=Pseudonocardia ammonioxydans TaxID=260086 RepID=A0A1I5G8X4_PSUAM|nr:phospholipid scramblase-related protein [Pseudonocardia ammonioxydans]SFO32505.1 Uncharacterized protein YxjI [Pseudonocardia ammonioxydans]
MSSHPSSVPDRPVEKAGTPNRGGTLFTEPVLVVRQRDKIVEVTNEYDVYDRHGGSLGTAVQIGQNRLAKVIRVVGKSDHFKTVHLEVRDPDGTPVLQIIRPAKIVRSRAVVQRPDGTGVGEIRQDNALGRIRFSLLADGRRIGRIVATTWWAREFTITDQDDVEVARIVQTWEGLTKAVFSTADSYVVEIHRRQGEPLASMIVASALTVDTALKQDAR